MALSLIEIIAVMVVGILLVYLIIGLILGIYFTISWLRESTSTSSILKFVIFSPLVIFFIGVMWGVIVVDWIWGWWYNHKYQKDGISYLLEIDHNNLSGFYPVIQNLPQEELTQLIQNAKSKKMRGVAISLLSDLDVLKTLVFDSDEYWIIKAAVERLITMGENDLIYDAYMYLIKHDRFAYIDYFDVWENLSDPILMERIVEATEEIGNHETAKEFQEILDKWRAARARYGCPDHENQGRLSHNCGDGWDNQILSNQISSASI